MARGTFLSYRSADQAWAEWIAWELEAAGYKTFVQAWDFRPGQNFVHQMPAGSLFLPPDHSGLDAFCSSWTEHIQGGPWVKGSGKVQAEIRYFLSSFAGEPLILRRLCRHWSIEKKRALHER